MAALVAWSYADSPLTSTDFWEVYGDVPQVVSARQEGRLQESLIEFLLSKASIDRKAALINALGWSAEGKHNASLFRKALADKYAAGNPENQMSAEEAFCLGYLMALDDYQNSAAATPYLQKAHQAKPKSFTVAVVAALVRAQNTDNPDERWALMVRVSDDKGLNRDLRGGARDAILDYMRPR